MLTVVFLPAPFDPSRAKISPRRTERSTPFRTGVSLKALVRPVVWTAMSVIARSPSGSLFHHVAVERLMPVLGVCPGVPQELVAELGHVLAGDVQRALAVGGTGFEQLEQVPQDRDDVHATAG